MGVGLDAEPSPAFAGDAVTLTVDGSVPDSTSLQIDTATVAFGDGSTGTVSGSCADRIVAIHANPRAGDYAPTVIALTGCPDSPPAALAAAPSTSR